MAHGYQFIFGPWDRPNCSWASSVDTRMNARAATVSSLILLIAATASAADEMASSQWKYGNLSMYELVGNGYSIVAAASDVNPRGVSLETFFLQKGNSVYKCSETHVSDVRTRKTAAMFGCWELVKPYALPEGK